MHLAEIPGLQKVLLETSARDCELRDFSLLGLPRTLELKSCVQGETVRVEIMLMTLRQYLSLSLMKNPFVSGGDVGPEHVAQFLWFLSPGYVDPFLRGVGPARRRARLALCTRRRREFVNLIATADFEHARETIRAYMDDMLNDGPTGSSSYLPVTSFASVIVEMLFPWTRDYVLDSPLPALWQDIRRAILHKNPKASIVDRRTDSIRRKFIKGFMQHTKDRP